MTVVDEIVETKAEKEWISWKDKVLDYVDEIAEFVAHRREGGNATRIVHYYRGSFNICIRIRFEDEGPDAIIRFPKAGVTSLRDEKVESEVQVMKFLIQNTTIPIPRLISWGLTKESPGSLGPFIIMDYVEGVHLSDVLKKPTRHKQEKEILNPDINDTTLDIVYRQIANFMLQLYGHDFSRIGAISEDPNGTKSWSVTGRPLTYNMNELVTSTGYPIDSFHTRPFTSTSEYFRNLADVHLIHLETQRNVTANPEDARRHYTARHLFTRLAAGHYTHENGPFKLFCDDLRPANILVDKNLQITAVLDLEFTNAMPPQFAYDPPWWLLLVGAEMWLERGNAMEDFVRLYAPRMEQFLRAMEQAEAGRKEDGAPCLSSLMRDSWNSGQFWFNLAARKSLDVDAISETQLDQIYFFRQCWRGPA